MKNYQLISRQNGLTLTELMVAVAIGLIVSAAVTGLFLQTSASNKQNNEIGYLQDNGRYALKVLADDLEMSNFWAGMSASDRSSIGKDNTSVAQNGGATISAQIDYDVNGLCDDGVATTTGDNWNYDLTQPLTYLDTTNEAGAQAALPCIPDNPEVVANTDVLMIKRTRGEELDSNQVNGRPYIRGNRSVATLHKFVEGGVTKAPPTGFFDWQYLNHIYYIGIDDGCLADCEPRLVRRALKEAGISPSTANPTTADPEFTTEEVAEGIERFNIQFGIDTSSDGVADFFSSSPTDAELLNAVVAKVYVLARSKNEVTGYNNSKTYRLGDVAVPVNDSYYRRVFSTTVSMKNTQAILEM